MFRSHHDEVLRAHPSLSLHRLIHETVRRMIGAQVTDLIETSRRRIGDSGAESIEEVRRCPQPLVAFSPPMRLQLRSLKAFLMSHLYRHYRVRRMSARADCIVRALSQAYMSDTGPLPPAAINGDGTRAQAITDYIAGMTDRYAIAEYGRIVVAGELR